MKYVYYSGGLLILFLIQSMCQNFYFDIKPNFLLVFALCIAVVESLNISIVYSIISGLLLDISGSLTFGSNVLLLLYFIFICSIIFNTYFSRNYFVGIIFVSIGSLLYEFFFYIFNFTLWGKGDFFYAFLKLIIPEFLYNTLFTVIILWFVRSVHTRFFSNYYQ